MGLDDTDSSTGALLSIGGTALFFWALSPWLLNPAWFLHPTVLVFVAVGLLWPAMGQSLQIQAVQRVGPALSASLGSLTPLFATFMALTFLGESISLQRAMGMGLLMLGLIYAAWKPSAVQRHFPTWALLFPLGAALARGIAQPISKLAMQDIPSPYFSTLVAGTTSLALLLLLRPLSSPDRRRGPRGQRIFLATGVINGLGIFCLNLALTHGKVTLVASLVATSPLFALALSAWWFKREKLEAKHGLVALMVFIGTVLLVWR